SGAELEKHAPDDLRVGYGIAALARRLGLIAPELLHHVLAALGERGEPLGQEGLLRIPCLGHGYLAGCWKDRRPPADPRKDRGRGRARPACAGKPARRVQASVPGCCVWPKDAYHAARRSQGG